MTKWTKIHKSKICAKKEQNRRVKIKHFTALSISSSFKLLYASVCYFWIMQSSYFTITCQINRKLRALKSLRTAGKGKTSSQKNKDILGKETSSKPYFWSMTTYPLWCAISTNSTMKGPITNEVSPPVRSLLHSGDHETLQRALPGRTQLIPPGPNKTPTPLKFYLLANATEYFAPPSQSGILSINVCMAGSHLSPPQGQVGGKNLLQFWLFILNTGVWVILMQLEQDSSNFFSVKQHLLKGNKIFLLVKIILPV